MGNPLRLRLTAGQESDIGQAVEMVDGLVFDRLIADRGYAAQGFCVWMVEQEIEPAIPPSGGQRRQSQPYDRWQYRERHLVERFVNKIKHFRRVIFWFDKLASRYMGFLLFALSLIWLR